MYPTLPTALVALLSPAVGGDSASDESKSRLEGGEMHVKVGYRGWGTPPISGSVRSQHQQEEACPS